MTSLAPNRRKTIGLLGALVCGALLVAAGHASELSATGATSGFVIHGAEETLTRFCRTDADGRLWLELPGGTRHELVTSISDPAIANQGDGRFHPFDNREVRSVLDAVRFPLARISAEVFILPFPRRGGLESAAGPGLILMSPGVWPLSPGHQHAEFTHELGHVVQYALLPDADVERWNVYRKLRGIDDAAIFAATGPHADRPHEIFAEDFRMLFGDPLANYSGSIENPRLALPDGIAGLERFMLELGEGVQAAAALSGFPNPARGAVLFSRPGGVAATLELFDLSGRRIAAVAPAVAGGIVSWSWDGSGGDGRRPGPGVVFARVRGTGESTRISLLP